MREEDSNWCATWEEALLSPEELIPSSQSLITPQPLPQPTPTQTNSSPNSAGDEPARIRTRFKWTPQLHKHFVDTVEHLGIHRAVPRTIMQYMNVEGLTRANVASHLQKYRLYLKRMQSDRGRGYVGGSGYLIRQSSLHLRSQVANYAEDLEPGAKTVLTLFPAREDLNNNQV